MADARPGPRRDPRLRGGAGSGQRRPRPAGRLLPRLAWPRWSGRRSATASATSSASSSRRSSDGWQVEKTDNWLVSGNPWEIDKPDASYLVNWGGHTEAYEDVTGKFRVRWVPQRVLQGVSYDTPVQGYGVNTCNTLTLWSARAVESFALDAFNTGDFYKAVDEEVVSETVSKVLYPNDEPEAGKRLRLLQQYFFVTCSLQDILQHPHRAGRAAAERAARRSGRSSSTTPTRRSRSPS